MEFLHHGGDDMVGRFAELIQRHDPQTVGITELQSPCGIDILATIAAFPDLQPISRSEVVDASNSDPFWGDAQAGDIPNCGHGETNPSSGQ